jgi:hypothetical protein
LQAACSPWPTDGENDIYETMTAANRTPFGSYVHDSAQNKQHWFQHQADGTQWHTMAIGVGAHGDQDLSRRGAGLDRHRRQCDPRCRPPPQLPVRRVEEHDDGQRADAGR